MSVNDFTVMALRLFGFIAVLYGLWALIGNLVAGTTAFDPGYIGYYFKIVLFRPLLAIALGALVWGLSRRLTRLLTRGLAEK